VSGPTGLSADLQRYLQQGRDGLLRSLDGVSEYDARRPLVPSGTNLLGLVKHVAGVELGYLVESVGREAPGAAVERGRLGLGGRRHVGAGRREP
jgi:hypothetical protein